MAAFEKNRLTCGSGRFLADAINPDARHPEISGDDAAGRNPVTSGNIVSMVRAKTPPKDLKEAGSALWRKLTREFQFNAAEFELLHQLGVTLDEIAALKADLSDMGMVVAGSEGQPRANPLIDKLVAHRKLVDQLVVALALPAEGEAVGRRRRAQARTAANSRWRSPKLKGRVAVVTTRPGDA